MRPTSIVNFERLYLGALAIGVLNMVLTWNQSVEALQSQPAGQVLGSNFLLFTALIGIVIPIILWYFIARKASNVAKWILVVLFVIGLIGLVMAISNDTLPEGIPAILSGVGWLMQAAAVWMLFRPDAKAWLAKDQAPADPDVFR